MTTGIDKLKTRLNKTIERQKEALDSTQIELKELIDLEKATPKK